MWVHTIIAFEVTRTQLLICVGCPVQLIRKVFLKLHFEIAFWGACLRFASLSRASSRGDSCLLGVHLSKVCWGLTFCLRKAFIFQKVCWISVKRSLIESVFAESSKAIVIQQFAVKFYFGLSLHTFQHGSSLSLENVCDSCCMHQTGFSSAAVVPQSKSTEMWSLAVPFDHDLWYFRHRTNERTL